MLCVGEGYPAEVDPLDDWETGGYPSIDDEIRTWCSNWCVTRNQGFDGELADASVVCEDDNWSGHGTRAPWHPDDGYDCVVVMNLNEDDPDGSDIEWDLVGGPSTPIPLDCDLDDDCADWFYPSVAEFILLAGAADVIEPETRTAHYLGEDQGTSSLEIDMPGPGDDTEDVFGQAEYSAVDCGDDVCPFYLANLAAWNNGIDTWEIRIETTWGLEQGEFNKLSVDLLQSTLGVHNTNLDIVAFAPGSLRLLVGFTLSGTRVGEGRHTYVVENDDYVFADYDGGDLSLELEFDIQSAGGTATLVVEVEADEHPPVAAHDLDATEDCDLIVPGHLLTGHDGSSDPDNDIDFGIWWVDGVSCMTSNGCYIPEGTHSIVLEVVDERGAADVTDPHEVQVSSCT